MNDLERSTYCEPDFSLANEFVNDTMDEQEKDIIHRMLSEQLNESKGIQEMLEIMLGDWEEYDNE
jgi:hypothetical protein